MWKCGELDVYNFRKEHNLFPVFRMVDTCHTNAYIPYFWFAVLGIVFAVVLFILRKKRFTFLAGIGMIAIYLIVAGFAYIVCTVNATRMRHLLFYEGKIIVMTIDDKHYVWNGEGYYNFGTTETKILGSGSGEDYSQENYYAAQSSAALGSIALGAANGIRLTNLSSLISLNNL